MFRLLLRTGCPFFVDLLVNICSLWVGGLELESPFSKPLSLSLVMGSVFLLGLKLQCRPRHFIPCGLGLRALTLNHQNLNPDPEL